MVTDRKEMFRCDGVESTDKSAYVRR